MKTNWIRVEPQENYPSPIQYAIAAFEQDVRRTFLTMTPSPSVSVIEIIINNKIKREEYLIEVDKNSIRVSGGDELGCVYGIYHISEHFLSIDPCYYFTHIFPVPRAEIDIPENIFKSKPATFSFRGMFLNDEDLLVGFRMAKMEHGFNLEVMRDIFEMMLRLKCNCVVPGTNILSDEEQVKLASDMGLIIAQHHAEPLGCAPFYWPRGIPFSWSTNREEIINYWEKAVKRNVAKRVLWTLNFRGLLDRPFWADDPNIDANAPMEVKAKIINEVLNTQASLVKKRKPDNDLPFIFYLWGELLAIYKEGLLKLPENTIVVYADAGYGIMESHPTTFMGLNNVDVNSAFPSQKRIIALPADDEKGKFGVYQHVQMFDGMGSQRCNSIKPEIFHREFHKIVAKKMTNFLLLNVSNVREHIFGIRQIMLYANDYSTYENKTADFFYIHYARNVYGEAQALLWAELYQEYFHLPFVFDQDYPDYTVHDHLYIIAIRFILRQLYRREQDNPNPFFSAIFKCQTLLETVERCSSLSGQKRAEWQALLDKMRGAADLLSPQRKFFFDHEIFHQTKRTAKMNEILFFFTSSIAKYLKNNFYEAYLDCEQACLNYEELLAIVKEIEYDQFTNWNRNDLNVRLEKNYEFLKGYRTMLDHLRWMNLPGDAEGPQPVFAAYHYSTNFKTSYRKELPALTER